MRKSRFADEQIVAMLREKYREAVPSVAKRHKVSEQTIYSWRKRFGALQPDDVRRLKQLDQENARLKKLVAKRDPEIEVMKEIAAKKERAGSPRAGGVCDTPWAVAAAGLHADEGGARRSATGRGRRSGIGRCWRGWRRCRRSIRATATGASESSRAVTAMP
jgi:putative transposase